MTEKSKIDGREHSDKWAMETFSMAKLGNQRCTDRFVKMAIVMAENSSAPLQESMRDWADTLTTAYRFLDNEVMQGSRVLLAADTTDINLSSHETTEGLGSTGHRNKVHGIFIHDEVPEAEDSSAQHLKTLAHSLLPPRGRFLSLPAQHKRPIYNAFVQISWQEVRIQTRVYPNACSRESSSQGVVEVLA